MKIFLNSKKMGGSIVMLHCLRNLLNVTATTQALRAPWAYRPLVYLLTSLKIITYLKYSNNDQIKYSEYLVCHFERVIVPEPCLL